MPSLPRRYIARVTFGTPPRTRSTTFGHRLLLLNHIGCITGKPRQTILEVAGHDAADGSYVVASGWGPTAAWYRNILQSPDVTIQVGTRTIPVTAVPLGMDEGAG